MSVNPDEIIRKIEFGTSSLSRRINALNDMAEAGYPVGLLIAPVILLPDWKNLYGRLIDRLSDTLSDKVKRTGFIEIILMTYSFVHHAINTEAFPQAVSLYDKSIMTGRGRGKYSYRQDIRRKRKAFKRKAFESLSSMPILYIS